jgi:hypothetical protein
VILGPHTVTVLRYGTTQDRFGNDVRSGTPTQVTVTGCSVQPLEGDEQTVNRDTVVSRWRIWAPPATDLTAADMVRFDGDDYEVDGEVQRWAFGTSQDHVTALLQRSS